MPAAGDSSFSCFYLVFHEASEKSRERTNADTACKGIYGYLRSISAALLAGFSIEMRGKRQKKKYSHYMGKNPICIRR